MRNKAFTRKCVACREHADKSQMLRFVVKSGEATLDLNGKAEGRGAYICRNQACVELAKKKNSLARALKCGVADTTWQSAIEDINRG